MEGEALLEGVVRRQRSYWIRHDQATAAWPTKQPLDVHAPPDCPALETLCFRERCPCLSSWRPRSARVVSGAQQAVGFSLESAQAQGLIVLEETPCLDEPRPSP